MSPPDPRCPSCGRKPFECICNAMTDKYDTLIERLTQIAHRDYAEQDPTRGEFFEIEGRTIMEAADALATLLHQYQQSNACHLEAEKDLEEAQAEIAKLREALTKIASLEWTAADGGEPATIARAALGGKE